MLVEVFNYEGEYVVIGRGGSGSNIGVVGRVEWRRRQTLHISHEVKHVLLLSIDGMHAVDFFNCSHGIEGVNGGDPYCPNMEP